MSRALTFHVHGDNIVECERTLAWVLAGFGSEASPVLGLGGSPVCPRFDLVLPSSQVTLRFIFFPGFGRWNEDILQHVRQRGGLLREAPDVVITRVERTGESLIIAIEYCGALPAGNQAWQRSGRAYSFGLADIPYFYVAELGGYELDGNRKRKAARMPNPAVPFSYLAFSAERDVPVLPVFVTSPGADEVSRRVHADEFGNSEFAALLRRVVLGEETSAIVKGIEAKVIALVRKRAAAARKGRTLTPELWERAYAAVKGGTHLSDFLVDHAPISWSKTAYIDALTASAKKLMGLGKKYGVGFTSSELPICIIPAARREVFAEHVSALYSDSLSQAFMQWLRRSRNLTICWVMGFKPRGDDARPDRGLPPLARMLAGSAEDLLTVVYGPAPSSTWTLLVRNPMGLCERNGLWEAILAASDGVLVDSATDTVTDHGFLRANWVVRDGLSTEERGFVVDPAPTRIGENDVDTVLHLLIAHCAGEDAFEGMCNPPGGDWSGVSVQTPDRTHELRWLSLPRVSGPASKRPDHVFQFFGIAERPIVLAVESKETAASVEKGIGPRLSRYVRSLFRSPVSVDREVQSNTWCHSARRLSTDSFTFASGVAFIARAEGDIRSVTGKAESDLIFAFQFSADGAICKIRIVSTTSTARRIAEYLSTLDLSGSGISIASA